MTAADRKRLTVLRRISDVFGDRLYDSMSDFRAVQAETAWLRTHNLIEPYTDSDGEHRYRITAAGRDQLEQWEAQ